MPLAATSKARPCRARVPPDARHTPNANATKSALERLKSGTTRRLVGAPIAKSSLGACVVKLYPGYRKPATTSVPMYAKGARTPHASRIVVRVEEESTGLDVVIAII